jgi:acyl-CoA synthetase (AMP-forming)/AMP-acid ligase II
MPEAQIRVLAANGAEQPVGSAGEVVCRSSISDFTYHGDDTRRSAADRSGLFATGDIGYLDSEGFLYLCDRAKDMLISGGVKIYPAEIEAELHKMPGVADCAVFGVPDEEYGEAVCAAVELQRGAELTDADVKTYLRGHLASFKVPKRVDLNASYASPTGPGSTAGSDEHEWLLPRSSLQSARAARSACPRAPSTRTPCPWKRARSSEFLRRQLSRPARDRGQISV